MKILADASLPGLNEAFPKPFKLSQYHSNDELIRLLDNQDILLCRANTKINRDLIKQNTSLKYIATASSGSDHLESNYLESLNIQILDAKGCNATAVADYVVSTIAYLEQHHLMPGKKAGVIGLGHVGSIVFKRLQAAGFDVLCYDPLKANEESTFNSCKKEELMSCNLLCIHAELHSNPPHPSVNLIDESFLAELKPGTVLINASRGGVVAENALLNTPTPLIYCTDVFLNEPEVNPDVINKATLCTPHIAGHSIEAKYKAVSLISEQIHQLAQLPVPQITFPSMPNQLPLNDNKTWQEHLLSIYDPSKETLELKKGIDKKSCFLSLRKKHTVRHDFSQYFTLMPNKLKGLI